MADLSALDRLQYSGQFTRGSAPSLRWGIAGSGWIADRFMEAVTRHTDQRPVAVGSRTAARSSDFANRWGLARHHDSYSGVIADEDVDVLYIAMTADTHVEVALEAIAAGKPVLIEKPLALDAAGARRVRDAARAAGVLAMEAMWSRYLPQADAVRWLVREGALGEIEQIAADHGQALSGDPASRLLDAGRGGGALLDLGVYPICFASEHLGKPDKVVAAGHLHSSGVDAAVGMVLHYPGSSAQSHLSTTIETRTPVRASISGTQRRVELDSAFYMPSGFRVFESASEEPILVWRDQTGIAMHEGLCYQANALASYAADGVTDSPIYGLDESVSVFETIDEAKRQIWSRGSDQ